jgi:hypothetical protein
LEVGGALNGTELADTKHGPSDWSFQADGIGNQRPHVGMRLQDERDAFDGGGVSTFAAFRETLLDEALWFGEERGTLARVTFSTCVIDKAFTAGGLREDAGEGEFANAVLTGKEKRMGYAIGTQSSAQRGNDLRVAAKFGPGHG